MKIENQVCSLEISKKLKGLKVKQDSLFYWDSHAVEKISGEFGLTSDGEFSAYTVAELGEMSSFVMGVWPTKFGGIWGVTMYIQDEGTVSICGHTEADARGKMLIYLIENKIIEVTK